MAERVQGLETYRRSLALLRVESSLARMLLLERTMRCPYFQCCIDEYGLERDFSLAPGVQYAQALYASWSMVS